MGLLWGGDPTYTALRRRPVAAPLSVAPVVTGTADLPLGGLALTASATVGHPASASAPLGGLSLSATAAVTHPATAALPLGGLALTGSATVAHPAAAALSLGSLALAGTATRATAGSAALPLGGLALTATGTRTTSGSAALVLGALALAATGSAVHPGVAALPLGGLALSAAGTVGHTGVAAAPLGGLTLATAGTVSHTGAAALPLGGLTLAADGAPPTTTPWLHRTVGVAARNGGATHTITFATDGDDPFTPTDGTLLLVIVAGSVTNAWSAGWTEQLQPVNNAELSVGTITASSTADVTLTHNASGYPIAWAAYEFPAGSTWVNGASASGQGNTAAQPTVGSLPGTPVVVMYAVASSIAVSGAAALSATWPVTEDVDLFEDDDGVTDGIWLGVGYETGVTATSADTTPTLTNPRASNTERASFALDVPTAASVTGSAALPLGGLALAASGTVTHLASAALSLGSLTLTAAGTVKHTGSAALPLGGLSLSATAPGAVFATLALGGLTLRVSGGYSDVYGDTYDDAGAVVTHPAAAAMPLGGLSLAASGTVKHLGSAALPLGGLTLAGSGTVKHTASAALPLGGLTLSVTAVVTHPATASLPLGGLVLGALADTDDGIMAVAAFPLGGLTLVVTATIRHPASATLPLGSLSLAAAGTRRTPGTAALPFGGLTLAATGVRALAGTVALNMGGLTLLVNIPPPVLQGAMWPVARRGFAMAAAAQVGPTMRGVY